MSALRAVEIGDPDRRTVPIQHLTDDARATAVADDVDHYLAVLEHPVPAGAAVDAYGVFVRAHDTGATQSCQDRADLSIKARGGTLEGSIQRALADGQPKQ